jgi:excisionase family DNA binding protein
MNDGTWISVGEAAREAGVVPKTVSRWADLGRVKSRRTVGGHRRVNRDHLRSLLTEATQRAGV